MYLALDIGGTQTRIASSVNCSKFEMPLIIDTPNDPNIAFESIKNNIVRIVGDNHIKGICVGIAGVLDAEHKTLLKSPHLPDWVGFPLKEKFIEHFSENVYLENDTDIVGLGEYSDGAGRTYDNFVYITISTGIGGVKIVDNKFTKTKYGFEPGHQILNAETMENWEDLASGTAIEKKFGMHPKEVAKTASWTEIENYINIGLHNSILHWSPDVLVIGGAMSKDLDVNRLKEGISKIMKIHPNLPEIKMAELGSLGGLYGGFAFLRGKV